MRLLYCLVLTVEAAGEEMALKISDLPEIEVVLRELGKPQFVVLRFDRFRAFIRKLEISGQIDEQDYLKRGCRQGRCRTKVFEWNRPLCQDWICGEANGQAAAAGEAT
jgi:hypothetical protein